MNSNDETSSGMSVGGITLGALALGATLSGCTGTVTVAGNVASMVVVLILLWSTVTMDRG